MYRRTPEIIHRPITVMHRDTVRRMTDNYRGHKTGESSRFPLIRRTINIKLYVAEACSRFCATRTIWNIHNGTPVHMLLITISVISPNRAMFTFLAKSLFHDPLPSDAEIDRGGDHAVHYSRVCNDTIAVERVPKTRIPP